MEDFSHRLEVSSRKLLRPAHLSTIEGIIQSFVLPLVYALLNIYNNSFRKISATTDNPEILRNLGETRKYKFD